MSSHLFHAIEQIGREKGIDVEIVIDAVKDAVVAASKKHFHTREELGAEFNREHGTYDVFALKKIVEEVTDSDLEVSLAEARKYDPRAEIDAMLRLPKPRVDLGRIAAQAAKQVIYQKVREAERENVFNEYNNRVGEVVNGIVKRFERGDIILDLGKTEAILPRREQSRAEHYNQSDRIRAIIVNVDKSTKGPQITISRTDTRLLMKLFEMEVPEIYDGTVIIESIARDPGDRAKVAVRSKEKDVDPVGACVGIKGSRVQAIIRELRGEKIDIVQWSEDPTVFVGNALNPAKVGRVTVADEANRRLEITVDDSQLSQAIGKKGQNVRLASQLVGWNIDIKSESEKKKEVEEDLARAQRDTREMKELPRVGEKIIQRLLDGGYRSLEVLVEARVDALRKVEGVGDKTANRIVEAAREMIILRREREAREAEEARTAARALEAAAALEGPTDETNAALQTRGEPALPAPVAGDPAEEASREEAPPGEPAGCIEAASPGPTRTQRAVEPPLQDLVESAAPGEASAEERAAETPHEGDEPAAADETAHRETV